MQANQFLFEHQEIIPLAMFWLFVLLAVLLYQRHRDRIQQARLDGMKEAVHLLSMNCSFSYERDGEDLPEAVTQALDYMARAQKNEKPATRCELYVIGAGMLGLWE